MARLDDVRGAIIGGAMTIATIGSGPVAEAASGQITDPGVREAVSSVSAGVHDSIEAWADDAARRDELADETGSPYEEPEVVDPREAEADAWGEPFDDLRAEVADAVETDAWAEQDDVWTDADDGDATNG